MVKKISKFNFGSKLALTILVISVILFVSILISALTPGVAPNPGHDIQNVAPPLGCVAGDLLKWDNPNWGCASDSYLQRRVNGICDQQTAIRAIYANGSVACQSITTGGTGDITAVYAGGGLSGGGTSGDVTLSVDIGTCPTGQFVTGVLNGQLVCSVIPAGTGGLWVPVTSTQQADGSRSPTQNCLDGGKIACEDPSRFVCQTGTSGLGPLIAWSGDGWYCGASSADWRNKITAVYCC